MSLKYSQELSRSASVGTSFCSEKDSVKEKEQRLLKKGNNVTWRRLLLMGGPDWMYGVFGSICCFMAGAEMPLFALGITQALVSFYMEWDVTKKEVRKIALLFCGGAIICLFICGLAHACFGIMGERLTLRVREKMFSAILSNEIGWFDDSRNSSSTLASRLESDATLLRTIVVDHITILLLNCGFIITALIIAFMFNWRLTLVLSMYPLVTSGHISEKLFMQGFGGNLSKGYLRASMLAGEAIGNIRTVAAFYAEEKVLDLYAHELIEPGRRSFRRGLIAGIFYGVSQFFIFSSYGLVLCYGAFLVDKGFLGSNRS